MWTLEKELNKLNVKEIDYLKIDTQGSELNILKGWVNSSHLP